MYRCTTENPKGAVACAVVALDRTSVGDTSAGLVVHSYLVYDTISFLHFYGYIETAQVESQCMQHLEKELQYYELYCTVDGWLTVTRSIRVAWEWKTSRTQTRL